MTFEAPASVADEAAGILVAYGAMGCEVTRASPAKPTGRGRKSVRLHAYFERLTPATRRGLTRILKAAGMITDGHEPAVRRIEDPGWTTMWQARFEPFPVGDHFLVVPPWNRAHDPRRLQIVIQPGQAFGTGHHASTFGTMCTMAEISGHGPIARALDVGTGSGILAIAMRKLGVPDVTAIDIDAVALGNAMENAGLNGLDDTIRFSAAPLSSIRGRFDLIAANILSSVLIEMAPLLIARMRPGAKLILAGILAREADSVTSAYRPHVKPMGARTDGSWTALVFRR